MFCSTNLLLGQSEPITIGELPFEINETSGLIQYNDRLITHNDSGNLPQLYEIDKNTLEITRIVTVANVVNTDWEDITQDDDFIYIGDIGNNNGNRTDLKILRIRKSDYDVLDTVTAETISYAYEDQTSFISDRNNDFDAEALLVFGDDLLIFTKEWQSRGTVAYRIPKLPGDFTAVNIGRYQIDGLVTGAAQNSVNANEFYLVGYSEILLPFFVRFNFQDSATIFSGVIEKSSLNTGIAQIESITFNAEMNLFYVTSEEFINQPIINSSARLFSFSLDDNEDATDDNSDNEEDNEEVEELPVTLEEDVIIFRPLGESNIQYSINIPSQLLAIAIYDASGRLLDFNVEENIENSVLPTETLSTGLYFATFLFEDRRISKAFQKN